MAFLARPVVARPARRFSAAAAAAAVTVNGREYALPTAPTVVICLDGSEPAYMHEGAWAGLALGGRPP